MNKGRKDAGHLLAHLTNGERDVVALIAKQKPLDEIKAKIGLPRRTIEGLIHSAKIMLSANGDLVDEYLAMVEDWQRETGSRLFSNMIVASPDEAALVSDPPPADKSRILEDIEASMTPAEMRDLAGSLLRLADAFEQDWSPDSVQAAFHWPSGAAKIERNSLELAKRATLLVRQRQMRETFLPSDLFGEPGWNMLLDLFIQFAGGAKVSGKSLSIAAGCPQTTALRHLARLEEAGLVKREPSRHDARVTLYSLTKQGVIGVGRVLERMVG
ncbi:MarR family winged helix-turn-helix transcriptional regulator [Erythrobacter sp. JK5]|uniref:MarR family winged helix-turn-helix transcriptional regulator n=1 Tax=Erythrobacter sp. JK5 TaxID=2829500 RepID=UPI001BA8B42F|nr:winged helix DNA-binding protein [Erythrobacter sp. JK5]QUL38372.1 winged helix DNA-binding protein [Erythrobacter sp. JK5]